MSRKRSLIWKAYEPVTLTLSEGYDYEKTMQTVQHYQGGRKWKISNASGHDDKTKQTFKLSLIVHCDLEAHRRSLNWGWKAIPQYEKSVVTIKL